MACIRADFNQIRPDQIDPAIRYRTFVYVSRVTRTSLTVKVLFDKASHHIPNKQRIYEQLGEHYLILKYY